jgi:hypothetical protein
VKLILPEIGAKTTSESSGVAAGIVGCWKLDWRASLNSAVVKEIASVSHALIRA